MKTTGIFTQTKYVVDFQKYGEPIQLVPFGDIHRSAPLHHEEKWKEWIAWAKGLSNPYYIGMGDYDDLSSSSEREILSNHHIHESTARTLNELYKQKTKRLCDELDFMKGRIIGLIEGNHYSDLSSGITTTNYMCELLECKYLGVSAFVRLALRYKCGNSNSIDIWGHHGLGGGRTAGASINKLENMIKAAHADIYLMGHDHTKHVAMRSRLELSEGGGELNLKNKKIIMGRTGSFLRGYVDGEASYVADAAYSPLDLGSILITMTPQRKEKDGVEDRWVEMTASL